MSKIFRFKPGWALVIFTFLDTICVGMGMGVPIFNILFGFLVGWYIVGMIATTKEQLGQVLNKILLYAVITSLVTFVEMVVIWGRTTAMLFAPEADLANFGIPMILYEPRASFIGWLVLMMVISPFLQLLATVFGSHLMLLFLYKTQQTSTQHAQEV